jgi:hypothetical protein
MEKRKRKAKNFPPHIDPQRLPKGIYWDASGNGHWYSSFKDASGKQRRKRVAGTETAMSALHRIMETKEIVDENTFDYIAEQYFDSMAYKELKPKTKKQYMLSFTQVSTYELPSGILLGNESLALWQLADSQRLLDEFHMKRGPTAANHMARTCRRIFNWSIQRGFACDNPFTGIQMATEKPKRILPKMDAYTAVLEYSKTTGYSYMWICMELAFICRMRGAEVLLLTDAHELEDGLAISRLKGSRDNVVKWNDRLLVAWEAAKALRQRIIDKKKITLSSYPDERFIFVSRLGRPLAKGGFDTAWQRMITGALAANVITEADRFSPHDLKRMGVTYTKGNRAVKQEASGHRSAAMMDIYDKSLPLVSPAGE